VSRLQPGSAQAKERSRPTSTPAQGRRAETIQRSSASADKEKTVATERKKKEAAKEEEAFDAERKLSVAPAMKKKEADATAEKKSGLTSDLISLAEIVRSNFKDAPVSSAEEKTAMLRGIWKKIDPTLVKKQLSQEEAREVDLFIEKIGTIQSTKSTDKSTEEGENIEGLKRVELLKVETQEKKSTAKTYTFFMKQKSRPITHRISVNCEVASIPDLLTDLALVIRSVPEIVRFKVAGSSVAMTKADVFNIYLSCTTDLKAREVAEVLAKLWKGQLLQGERRLQVAVAEGISFAQEPVRTGAFKPSFGQKRALALMIALLHFREKKFDNFLDAVADAFRGTGLDPSQPHCNLAEGGKYTDLEKELYTYF